MAAPVLALVAAGCAGDDALPPMGLAAVRAAAARTRAGTAAVRISQELVPSGGGRDTITGSWDFVRREGTFRSPDGTALVVANGAEFDQLSAAARAEQADDAPEYRYAWSQRPVVTTDDIDVDEYFGLAIESAATFWQAFDILNRASAVVDLGATDVAGVVTRHLRVTVPPTPEGGDPPEVWLDREGRARRLRLSSGDSIRLNLVVQLTDFGVAVQAVVPPLGQLSASGANVPIAPWRTVRAGQEAGRRWRVRTAPDNVVHTNPPERGACVAIEVEPFPPAETPPTWFECRGPNPVVAYRIVPPELRGQVLVGSAGSPRQQVPVGFTDGTTGTAPVVDGVFVHFTNGRQVAEVDGQPLS